MSESAERVAPPPHGLGFAVSRDERLAKRAAAGDDGAFEALFKRYSQPLYRYCRAILTDSEDAEDAVQATMVKALRALPGEQRQIALRPWLYRVAHNESISILRARRVTGGLEPAELADSASMEGTVEMRDRIRTLVADLETLPERQRASLVMRELSDLSYEDIAAALSTSPAAAKQAVYEARTALLAVAEGREMDCATAREAISAGDRRVLRGRKVRAHLRACDGCSDFEAAIADRRETFTALAPPLAAPAALALLHGVIGGGGTAAGGTIGSGLAAGAAVKGAIAVVAVAAVGGGAAATGVLDRDRSDGQSNAAPAPASEASPNPASAREATTPATAPTDQRDARNGGGDGNDGDRGHAGNGGSQSQSPGNSGQAPGQGGEAPGQSGTPPGQAGTTPGQSGATPAQGAPPPGQSGAAPGQAHSNAGGGGQATAPGQSDASPGNSASAPGHATDAIATTDSEGQANATGHATAPGQNK